ncbi:MAG: hypothetical protein KKD86_11620 [Bacteroidetes bacterium]|nr:hypothetical protein [Bacteroidota bacterium]MBU1679478.1 hypothetical protein [Bacteroidota bacterium]
MNYELLVRPEAELEILDSVKWYEQKLKGLGSSFLLSFEAAIESISRTPEAHPLVSEQLTSQKAVFGKSSTTGYLVSI